MARVRNSDESGQAVVEYILLLAVLVGFFAGIRVALRNQGIAKALLRPLVEEHARAYQYGHPEAHGPEENGGPRKHPRIAGDGGLRTFLNPAAKGN